MGTARTRQAAPNNTRGRGRQAVQPGMTRTQVVWTALIASMTVVGGLLWMLDGAPRPDAAVLRIPALVASSGPKSLEAIFQTDSAVEPGRWHGIVVHHSGSPHGSATTIDAEHRQHGLNGLGYHFVIGNGNGAGNGELHVGARWLEQSHGAHTGGELGDWYNRNTIGICLVGDGSRRDFTPAQMQRLVGLVSELQERLGLPASSVKLHRELATTDSPGLRFPAAEFREQLLP
ncbi:MAG: peptidoglycan recognition family protein [Planctomycetota bacterium]